MSNKELCIKIINEFSEEQLSNVLSMLKNLKSFLDTAYDDNFCNKLLDEYNKASDGDKNQLMSIYDFSQKLGIDLK